ncbi:DUF547 domain-containing protein [Cecembia rubra]|uniref:DUF547 domain-containing protein n=1 Tax=Cecembia rubra TaxID=1485585 RepID=UPI00271546F2|nr:DUF547 domain-containing protein [Cecembia rubra]
MKFLWITLTILLVNLSCGHSDLGQEGSLPPNHQVFDAFLKKFVSDEGIVNYKGMVQQRADLEIYLNALSQNPPDRKTWSKAEQLAYWINAYNAFTLKLILDHYPIKSIQDIKPKYPIPLVNTVWHMEFFKIGGKPASLDEIEHKILRKEFEEPRIHFAINCASFSCPILSKDAYFPEKLEEQLDKAARRFINDSKRNKISADKVNISKIFSWFGEDFTRKGNLIEYLNRYSTVRISPKAKINYLDYDWSLNE